MLVNTDLGSQLDSMRNQASHYLKRLWDDSTGGFRFAPHQPATLMATAYSVLGLEFIGALKQLEQAQRDAISAFLMANVQDDGSFQDPLFSFEDVLSKNHNLAYFQEETTTFCQQALDALGAPPPPPRQYSDARNTPQGMIRFCESLAWQNPWLDSNPVMFALSQLCHDAERHGQPELLETVDAALDWLDTHQSAQTGLWKGPHEVSLTNAMAATFHFTFFYYHRDRPLQYVERIIDSCLSLQEDHGLFSEYSVGQTCLDYDALDLLAKASLATDYRAHEVRNATARASEILLELRNTDGGFAHSKESIQYFDRGRKAKILRSLKLSQFIPEPARVPATGDYHVCWRYLSCNTAESNAFSTWFRFLALALANQYNWLNSGLMNALTFRRLPFLGHHKISRSC